MYVVALCRESACTARGDRFFPNQRFHSKTLFSLVAVLRRPASDRRVITPSAFSNKTEDNTKSILETAGLFAIVAAKNHAVFLLTAVRWSRHVLSSTMYTRFCRLGLRSSEVVTRLHSIPGSLSASNGTRKRLVCGIHSLPLQPSPQFPAGSESKTIATATHAPTTTNRSWG